jgi:hypothetical protein
LVNKDFVHELTETQEVLFSEMSNFVATTSSRAHENIVDSQPNLSFNLSELLRVLLRDNLPLHIFPFFCFTLLVLSEPRA